MSDSYLVRLARFREAAEAFIDEWYKAERKLGVQHPTDDFYTPAPVLPTMLGDVWRTVRRTGADLLPDTYVSEEVFEGVFDLTELFRCPIRNEPFRVVDIVASILDEVRTYEFEHQLNEPSSSRQAASEVTEPADVVATDGTHHPACNSADAREILRREWRRPMEKTTFFERLGKGLLPMVVREGKRFRVARNASERHRR